MFFFVPPNVIMQIFYPEQDIFQIDVGKLTRNEFSTGNGFKRTG